MRKNNFLFLALVLVGLLVGIFLGEFILAIPNLGHYIIAFSPQINLLNDYTIAVVWAITLAIFISLWPVAEADKRALLWLWLARILVTLGFMLFYENYYPLDGYIYFAKSIQNNFSWENMGIGEGTVNFSALVWLHNRILPPSYHALKVSFSLIGLLAIYLIYRGFILLIGYSNRRFLYFFGLFPSILFWSSILGKDPVVMLGISMYFYGIVAWHIYKKNNFFLIVFLGIFIAVFIRVWLGIILLFPLVVFAILAIRGTIAKLFMVSLTLMIFLGMINLFSSQFSINTVEDLAPTVDQLAQGLAYGGSAQEIPRFLNLSDLITFWPLAVFTTLFRPLPGEVLNPFGLLAGLENGFLLINFVISVKKMRWQTLHEVKLIWIIVLIFTWASIYGFYSSANLGAAVRFKLQILPIVLCLFLYLNIKSKVNFISNRL